MLIGKFKAVLFSLTIACFIGLASASQVNAQSSTPDSNMWATDGEVYRTVTTGDRAYIGGNFSYVGQPVGCGMPVNLSNGASVTNFPKFNSTVRVVIDDGSGGWYVGGDFDKVDSTDIRYLAHVLSNGTLDAAWQPQPNSSVYSLSLLGDKLYVGGSFNQFGDSVIVTRNYLASFDTATGNLTAWDPSPNSIITSIVTTGTTIYIGGYFNSLDTESLTRNYFAAFTTVTGSSTSWNPNADSNPETMVLSADGTTIYVGGNFTNVDGDLRNYLAELDAVTGSSTAWDPSPDNQVKVLLLNGNDLYVGGSFGNIGGQARMYLAEIDITTALASSWNANPDSSITALALQGATLYVGGNFTSLGGLGRNYIGAVSTVTGVATSWNPNINSTISVLAFNTGKTTLFLGGDFYLANGVWRDYLAEINLTTGEATSWNANPDSLVRSLAFNPDKTILYVGGSFSNIGGAARSQIAALNRSTGIATAWDPSADNVVYALAVDPSGSPVYAGGDFSSIGGEARTFVAAIDASTGIATSFDPSATYWVRDLVLDSTGSRLYAGEYHRRCGGPGPLIISMAGVSAAAIPPLCTYSGAVQAFETSSGFSFWAKGLNNGAYALALSDDENTLYAGGSFANPGVIGASNYLLAMATYDGEISSTWAPNPNGGVTELMMNGRDLYVGGSFTAMGSETRNYAASISASDTSVGDWDPNLDGTVYAMATNGTTRKLIVGGGFWSVGSILHNSLASFDIPTVQFNPNTGSGSQTLTWPSVIVRLSEVLTDDVILDYEATGGTGVNGQNYILANDSVTIPAGSLTATIPLHILTQNSYQSAKNVVVSISNPNHVLIGTNGTFTYSIEAGGGGGGGGGAIYSLPVIGGAGLSVEQQNNARLARIATLPVPIHSLVKLADDGNPETQNDSAVYYVGADGYRHAFPNSKAYFTWYCDYSKVKVISIEEMSSMTLGQNVIYRPGMRMVKFQTSPVVYAVARYGVLRPMGSEEVAKALYGDKWNTKIDDIADTFFGDYTIGDAIKVASQFDPIAESVTVDNVSDTFSIVGYVPSIVGTPLVCEAEDTWPLSFSKDFRFTYDIYPGTTDTVVARNLQEFLMYQGTTIYSGGVTGTYGPLTTQGVRNFQAKYDIRQTGNVGPLTREKMNQMLGSY